MLSFSATFISSFFFRLTRQKSFRTNPSWIVLTVALTLATTTKIHAQNFSVNSTVDRVDVTPGDKLCDTGQKVNGVAECTLRAAVDEVNGLAKANPGAAYTVSIPAGTYFLTVVEVCPYYDVGNPNQLSRNAITLCISGNLTLTGAGPTTTVIDGGKIDRMIFVSNGVTAAINNMTIQNGTMAVPGSFDGSGGGVNNQGTLALTNDIFTKNDANNPSGGGGAVYNGGTLIVDGCSFLNNANTALVANYATTSINLSYFAGNTSNQGAAVETFTGTLNISNSTFANNTVTGNGIIGAYNVAATITNSTISNNTIGNDGAIWSYGNGSSLTLNNDTIYGNTAANTNSGGGVLGTNVSMANTILAGNTAPDCVVVSLVNYGHNIIQNADFVSLCKGGDNSSTLTGVDPKLGPVTFHAEIYPTQTPLPGSPAIGKGSDATPGSNLVSACTALDQRGFVRGANGNCTIGAVEADMGSQTPSILPSSHGASGTISAVIYGGSFDMGSTVAFQLSGKPTLVPTRTSADGSTKAITVTLNLAGAAVGAYDVVVTTPGAQTVTLPGAFSVEAVGAPDLYGYGIGPAQSRAGRPQFYSFVYGNRGNVDAYLVPMTIATPGPYAELLFGPIYAPPATSGQAISDFNDVPLEVLPLSATGYKNMPLLVPVIPAGSQGVFQFSLTPPSDFHGVSTYGYAGSLGDPYADASGVPSATAVSGLVVGAQSYAKAEFGVTVSAQTLAKMTAYATQQLQGELQNGEDALLRSGRGGPIFFSTAQLSIDVAAYGANLEGASGLPFNTPQKPAESNYKLDDQANDKRLLRPAYEGQYKSDLPEDCANQGVMKPGTSCQIGQCTGDGCDPDEDFKKKNHGPGTDPDECVEIPNHRISSDGMFCVPINTKTCGDPRNTDLLCTVIKIAQSIDPNEKDGPSGVGDAHFTRSGDPSGYQIEFENEATATGTAQAVTVTDALDASKFDLSTFELGPISFGKYRVRPSPGLKNYTVALDLRPDANVLVSIKGGLDSSTGIASWSFTSLDPATMKFTTDPLAGFLPPDTTPPAGIGRVGFSVRPLGSVASGTQICNTASVVFDTNAPIQTAAFCNSKDTTPPVSSVEPLSPSQSTTTFTVSWTGTDAGSGVAGYYIYVSDNGGPFTLWQTSTALNAVYTGTLGHTYGFFSDAVDNLGNTEVKTVADTTTTVGVAPVPKAALNPTSLAFGSVTVNTSAAAKTVTLSNAGNAALAITSISLTGPNASAFSIAANSCSASLAAGATCNISIMFSPTAVGTDTASLTVVDTVGTQTASLTGTATAAPAPQAALSPANANFGSVTTAATSAAQTFTLKNAGNAPLAITSISLLGANPSSFTISANACGSSLATGSSCTVSVTFSPKVTGTLSANLAVIDTIGTQTASLSGTGTAPSAPQAALNPASANFGSVTSGTTSAAQTFTLKNAGNASLPITSISLSGANPAAFAISANTCGSSLAAGSSCTISVTFAPSTVGNLTVNLTVIDTVGTQTAGLSGTSTAPPAAQAALTPSSASFGSVTVGTTAGPKVFTLINAGNAALTINSVTLGGANASVFAITANTCVTSLAAGRSCTITTTFTPVAAGNFAATVTIVDAVRTQSASLIGTATAAPAPADFTVTAAPGSQTTKAGGSVTYTITVSPTSGGPFPGTVTLSATGAPARSKVAFSPGSVTPGAAATNSTLTIVVPQAFASNSVPSVRRPGYGGIIAAGLCFPAAFLTLFVGRDRRRSYGMMVTLFLVLLGLGTCIISGCGGHAPPMAPITSTILITGASGSTAHSTNVSLVVQ